MWLGRRGGRGAGGGENYVITKRGFPDISIVLIIDWKLVKRLCAKERSQFRKISELVGFSCSIRIQPDKKISSWKSLVC